MLSLDSSSSTPSILKPSSPRTMAAPLDSAVASTAATGPVGWWKLDETDGNKAADSSGNGHDATIHGDPKWQPAGGKIGGALAFDGIAILRPSSSSARLP